MSHISRKFDPLTIAFWQGSCVLLVILRFYCCKLINHRKVRICLMLAKHSSNTVSIFFFSHPYSLNLESVLDLEGELTAAPEPITGCSQQDVELKVTKVRR